MSGNVRLARDDEAGRIQSIDPRVLDTPGRGLFIERAIAVNECYVATDGDAMTGYAVFDRSFYDQPFVSLLVVDAPRRRQGIGAALMRHIESICAGEKLFTSTNASNTAMQCLCEKLGFTRSGWIEHLDDGDPEIVYFKRPETERRP